MRRVLVRNKVMKHKLDSSDGLMRNWSRMNYIIKPRLNGIHGFLNKLNTFCLVYKHIPSYVQSSYATCLICTPAFSTKDFSHFLLVHIFFNLASPDHIDYFIT